MENTGSLPTLFISQSNFEKVIQFLLKYYTIISLSDYLNKNISQKEIPKNSVVITFDDGYKDVYENAFPILKQYKIPATIFITNSFIDSKKIFWWDRLYALCKNAEVSASLQALPNAIYNSDVQDRLLSIFSIDRKERDQHIFSLISELQAYDNSELEQLVQDLFHRLNTNLTIGESKMLSWDDIKELKTNGITFGSHTKTHLFLTSSLSRDVLLDEVRNSKFELEDKLKTKVIAFAYPGGKISPRVREIVKESGYEVACTQMPGINFVEEDILALKRINVWDGTVTGFWGKFSKSVFALQLIRTGAKT